VTKSKIVEVTAEFVTTLYRAQFGTEDAKGVRTKPGALELSTALKLGDRGQAMKMGDKYALDEMGVTNSELISAILQCTFTRTLVAR
jgi:hypothetical protein